MLNAGIYSKNPSVNPVPAILIKKNNASENPSILPFPVKIKTTPAKIFWFFAILSV